jgi:hypothetical protein
MQRFLSPRRLAGVALAGVIVAAVGLLLSPAPAYTADKAAVTLDPAAVERTRETVHMLDDLYKSAVVHITDTYVRARERTPAARAAKLVFKDMAAKGHHQARLIDATGDPVGKTNVARSDFEKRAVEQLKAGKPWYEEIGTRDGTPVFRAATPVPVVMKQCIDCHPGHKEGDLLGAITYELRIR